MSGVYKAIWLRNDGDVEVLDQTKLPFEKSTVVLKNTEDTVVAIKDMIVRGAGVIGSTAAMGMYLAVKESNSIEQMRENAKKIRESRPTAVNLMWAVDKMMEMVEANWNSGKSVIENLAKAEAIKLCEEDAKASKKIAENGCDIFEDIMKYKGIKKINVLTHCNAGWLAIVDDGTALAPIYEAKRRGLDIHVWVDETRPRNQGANLTAWELSQSGIPHTIIADNTGGHLMQHGMVDVAIVGADRVSRNGDVANKIGTYLKALSAVDNEVPFYVALPSSTFDFEIYDGVKDIPVETRSSDEVKYMRGVDSSGKVQEILITPDGSDAINYGFDVTPARLITGLITERGVITPTLEDIEEAYQDLI
jgi:methylthioribose-1-phosphate isomerase